MKRATLERESGEEEQRHLRKENHDLEPGSLIRTGKKHVEEGCFVMNEGPPREKRAIKGN